MVCFSSFKTFKLKSTKSNCHWKIENLLFLLSETFNKSAREKFAKEYPEMRKQVAILLVFTVVCYLQVPIHVAAEDATVEGTDRIHMPPSQPNLLPHLENDSINENGRRLIRRRPWRKRRTIKPNENGLITNKPNQSDFITNKPNQSDLITNKPNENGITNKPFLSGRKGEKGRSICSNLLYKCLNEDRVFGITCVTAYYKREKKKCEFEQDAAVMRRCRQLWQDTAVAMPMYPAVPC